MEITLQQGLKNIDRLVMSEDYVAALDLADGLAQQYPEESSIWRSRSYIHAHQGAHGQAILDISRALELCEMEPDYYFTRGRLRFQTEDYRKAILDFTRVLELCDIHNSDYYRQSAYFFRADSYLRLRNYKNVRTDCTQVRSGFKAWTDSLRTKEIILAECSRYESAG